MNRRWLAVFAIIASAATISLLASCRRGAGSAATTQASDEKVLNVYIWSEYLPKSVTDRFTARTGAKVIVTTYDDNETAQQQLQAKVVDYDIVVPSDYMVRALIAQNLIQPIDKSKLPHWSNLDPKLLNQPFDPHNEHSVPYLWGLTGLGYNKTKVQGPVDSWNVLFDEKNKGEINMLDDERECFAVALKLMGKSLNATDLPTLNEAADMLKKQKPLVKSYDKGDFTNKLASGDVWLTHGYTGQLAKLAHDEPDKFVVVMPKEGGTVSVDNLCIPTISKHADLAHQFIDFCLEPENAGEIGNATFYASPNLAARKFIKPELLNDPNVYPPDDVVKRCEFMKDLGDAALIYDQLWSEVKGS